MMTLPELYARARRLETLEHMLESRIKLLETRYHYQSNDTAYRFKHQSGAGDLARAHTKNELTFLRTLLTTTKG